ncbi:VPLPA-CTERM sorting domain-containing protein [Pseudooceanicola nitratireducens]|uniref:VPLPA-CTERM sorting domain-containing protein n=1 Tax=Pseudooceanicola nitratireducens TaxID=517719 RepID=UPI001C94A575|nr:VPLPA-CTERM sorting domain-containing protein [Pseudooceanicola nitratireducens]MBY6165870.1 VPLPA-CTERM sorting domain-containing protein [Pseudooceanicola nitratireducens]
MITRLLASAALLASAVTASAATTTYEVEAFAHSYIGGSGSGLDTGLSFAVGDTVTISADPQDTWVVNTTSSFGLTDANGYTGYVLYGPSSAGGFSAYFSSLVAQIGSTFYAVGLGASLNVTEAGSLVFFNWDSDTVMNSGSVTVTVDYGTPVVPLPAGLPLLAGGLLALGGLRRRR